MLPLLSVTPNNNRNAQELADKMLADRSAYAELEALACRDLVTIETTAGSGRRRPSLSAAGYGRGNKL